MIESDRIRVVQRDKKNDGIEPKDDIVFLIVGKLIFDKVLCAVGNVERIDCSLGLRLYGCAIGRRLRLSSFIERGSLRSLLKLSFVSEPLLLLTI